ncbi:hypothetical protein FSP39_020997 [Pinctada imbricata]|uniref:Homeobox domain-containing protein n=1 Tax=Pinctada imbricata TaxID=66713 RepID=A0AA88YEG3_PINIB|nr:hypothetical protein FSP39_020997 [Pinctada imbricata]
MEKTFAKNQYPDSEVLADLSDRLDIAHDKLIVWFQNRRSKFKRQSKGSKMSWMRKQFYVTSDSPKEISDQPSPRITPSSIFPAGHVISPQQTIGSQISRKLYFSPE